MFAILVTFELEPAGFETFLSEVRGNAAASLAEEPGCRRFDVLVEPDAPGRVVLYEIYDDAAAFEAHLLSAHFADFDRTTAPLVREKAVRRLALVA